jgi:hypothetical protein
MAGGNGQTQGTARRHGVLTKASAIPPGCVPAGLAAACRLHGGVATCELGHGRERGSEREESDE